MAVGIINISALRNIKTYYKNIIQILLTSKNIAEEQMTDFSYMAKGPLILNSILANETPLKFDSAFRLLHCAVPSMLISKDKFCATWFKARKENFYF